MDKDKQLEALARIEFGNRFDYVDPESPKIIWVLDDSQSGAIGFETRDYDSHDALQRTIDGLDRRDRHKYINELKHITCNNSFGYVPSNDELFKIANATTAQKREAILRSTGKWEGE